MPSRLRFAATAIAVTLAFSAAGQTLPQGVQKKASVGGITEYLYPNGLRVLLYPDPANPKVTINMTYLVGSRHEGLGRQAWPICSST
jgi:zinc protease